MTVENVRAFTIYLQQRETKYDRNPFLKGTSGKLSSAYIQGCVRVLRAFSSWLAEEGYTEENVLRPLRPPRVRRKVVDTLSDDEIKAILGALDPNDPFGARDYALVWTLLDCGLRASEICGLTQPGVDLGAGVLKVLGKGNKERLVPIGAACQKALLRWQNHFRPSFCDLPTNGFFLDASGYPLSTNALHCLVKRLGRRARVPRLHPHLFRHTFATNYLVHRVGDPFRLQQMLGHTTLEMVRHYVSKANLERDLLDRRASTMDVFLTNWGDHGKGRRVQARRNRPRLRAVR